MDAARILSWEPLSVKIRIMGKLVKQLNVVNKIDLPLHPVDPPLKYKHLIKSITKSQFKKTSEIRNRCFKTCSGILVKQILLRRQVPNLIDASSASSDF